MYAGVAQLVEHRFCNPRVGSSSLSASTTGELAERFNAPVLKTDVLKGTGGSNPSLSASTTCIKKPYFLYI